MAMCDRFPLDKIELPKNQERIMDVVCKAWDECDESECKGCIDRKSHFMSIRECVSIKASRMLVEEGYARVVRCKDCTHSQYSKGHGYICEYDNKCRHGMNYCSEGDPREDSIDVVEVVHAKWIDHKNGNATCSHCRIRQTAVYDDDNEQNFCGHCGAKMDGERKEQDNDNNQT